MTRPFAITKHAVDRYQERAFNIPEDEVRSILSTPFILCAARFGNCEVRLPTGHKAVIIDGVVVTVLPYHRFKRRKHKERET